jgi:hypothetical protein
MELITPQDASSSPAIQEIPNILQSLKVHYHAYESLAPALFSTLNQIPSKSTLTLSSHIHYDFSVVSSFLPELCMKF